jgi:hypothetical protein
MLALARDGHTGSKSHAMRRRERAACVARMRRTDNGELHDRRASATRITARRSLRMFAGHEKPEQPNIPQCSRYVNNDPPTGVPSHRLCITGRDSTTPPTSAAGRTPDAARSTRRARRIP